jgi:hypothetical protein
VIWFFSVLILLFNQFKDLFSALRIIEIVAG